MKTAREKSLKRKERAAVLVDKADTGDMADSGETVDTAQVEEEIEVQLEDQVTEDNAKRKLEEETPADYTRDIKKRRTSVDGQTGAPAEHPPGESYPTYLPQLAANGQTLPIAEVTPITTTTRKPLLWNEPEAWPTTTVLTKPTAEMRGHTSYLTFASYYPAIIRAQLAAQTKQILMSGKDTPIGSALRVAELVDQGRRHREGTATTLPDSEYGGQGIDEAIGSLTEEQYTAMYGRPV